MINRQWEEPANPEKAYISWLEDRDDNTDIDISGDPHEIIGKSEAVDVGYESDRDTDSAPESQPVLVDDDHRYTSKKSQGKVCV